MRECMDDMLQRGLDFRFQHVQEENLRLEKQIEDFELKIINLEGKIKRLKKERKQLKIDLEEAEKRCLQAESQREQANNQSASKVDPSDYETLQSDYRQLAEEKRAVSSELENVRAEQEKWVEEKNGFERKIEDLEVARMTGISSESPETRMKRWIERIERFTPEERLKYQAILVALYNSVRNIVAELKPEWLRASDYFPQAEEVRAIIALNRADLKRETEHMLNSQLPEEVKQKFIDNLDKELNTILQLFGV